MFWVASVISGAAAIAMAAAGRSVVFVTGNAKKLEEVSRFSVAGAEPGSVSVSGSRSNPETQFAVIPPNCELGCPVLVSRLVKGIQVGLFASLSPVE